MQHFPFSTMANALTQFPSHVKDTRRHNLVLNLLHLRESRHFVPVKRGNGCWKRNPKGKPSTDCLPTPRRKIFPCNAQIPFLEGEASSSTNSKHVRVSKFDVKRIIENKHDNNEACCTCYKRIDKLLRNRRFDGTARHMFRPIPFYTPRLRV